MSDNPEILCQLASIDIQLSDLIRRVSYGQSPGETVDDLLRLLREIERLKEKV